MIVEMCGGEHLDGERVERVRVERGRARQEARLRFGRAQRRLETRVRLAHALLLPRRLPRQHLAHARHVRHVRLHRPVRAELRCTHTCLNETTQQESFSGRRLARPICTRPMIQMWMWIWIWKSKSFGNGNVTYLMCCRHKNRKTIKRTTVPSST